jgi:hypothetical protein
MNSQAIDALKAIVEEVAGAGFPFSVDSYLPAHLIHDARQVIEAHDRDKALAADIAVSLRIAARDAK